MTLQRIQTVTTTITMIGVWSNLYINYSCIKKNAERDDKRK